MDILTELTSLNKLNGKIINPEIIEVEDRYSSKYQFKCICQQIKEFENNLDNEHEVALYFTSFGQSIIMNVTKISYQDPCLIFYYGNIKGQYSQLIQHINQVSFLLTSVQKQPSSASPRRVGFALIEE